MSFRKTNNKHSEWIEYCNIHRELIGRLNLPETVIINEDNFREFLNTSKIGSNSSLYDFDKLEDHIFWQLFDFINGFSGFDFETFTDFEKSRIQR